MSRQSCEHLAVFLRELEANNVSVKVYSVCLQSVGQAPEAEQSLSTEEFISGLSEYRVPYASSQARLYTLLPRTS